LCWHVLSLSLNRDQAAAFPLFVEGKCPVGGDISVDEVERFLLGSTGTRYPRWDETALTRA